MADTKTQILELDALATPTVGYNVHIQKTLGASKRLDLGLLQSYDTGSGYFGCYVQRQRIGAWNMKTSFKHTLALTDPSSIIAIEPGIIINDSSIQYPFHSVYDAYFYQNILNIARTAEAGMTGYTANPASGSVDNAVSGSTGYGNTNKTALQWGGKIAGTSAVATKEAGIGSIECIKNGTGRYLITHSTGKYVSALICPYKDDLLTPTWQLHHVNTNVIEVYFDAIENETNFYIEIYLPDTLDDHQHVIGNHSHDIGNHTHSVSVGGVITPIAGYWGKNIQVGYQWTEGATQVFLTHNNLGSDNAYASSFGTIVNSLSTNIMTAYQTAANRGYINIIRKFEA